MSADRLWPSDAWNLYQSHPDQHKVNFTLLLQPGYWFHGQEAGSNETWPQVRTPERFMLRCAVSPARLGESLGTRLTRPH